MESLHQFFTTVIAGLMFFILIIKFASSVTVNNGDHEQLNSNKLETNTIKRKSKKKVRFAVNHDEFVINKLITEPSESESVVLEQNLSEIESVDRKSIEGDENVGNCDIVDEKMCVKMICDDDGIDELVKEKEGLISEEDDSDWEGVERSELEKIFAVAADYGKVDDNLLNVDGDVQMELYGLYKVATEGPCHEGQPMALKVSARAKWNAWQKLGSMNPDVAMEQYITLLSEKVPGWSQGNHDSVWNCKEASDTVYVCGKSNCALDSDDKIFAKIIKIYQRFD